jgi:hypothetical protein
MNAPMPLNPITTPDPLTDSPIPVYSPGPDGSPFPRKSYLSIYLEYGIYDATYVHSFLTFTQTLLPYPSHHDI